ncbi:MAG: ankyrin repeat domain-containing protein [Thermoanaerobaculia bacterium]
MKKSCALSLVVGLVLFAAYAGVAWGKMHQVIPALIVGVLGATFAAVLLGSTLGYFQSRGDRTAIQRAARGEPRRDGRVEAASGSIRPLRAALEGPFSGTECVAYEYDVKNPGAERSDFAGVALAPSVIDTNTGPVKLLGWAALDEFAGSGEKIDRERAATYLARTAFEPLALKTALSALSSLLSDSDGSIRKDYQIENSAFDVEGRKLIEKVIPVGQTVTVLGVWFESQGGLAPSGERVNRILPVGPTLASAHVVESALKKLAVGAALFVALHAILVPMYLLSPAVAKRDRAGKEITHASVFDERDCARLPDLLAAGADPNESAIGGRTALMNAVGNGNIECVKSLVAAGARPNTKDEDGSSAMTWAITSERDDLVAVLKQAGGTDFRIDATNGRSLEAGDEPVRTALAYCAALQDGNLEELARLSSATTVDFIRKQNVLSVWQHTRPKEPLFVEGFTDGRAATIAMSGKTVSSPNPVLFHFHLEKGPAGWHVAREWFKD